MTETIEVLPPHNPCPWCGKSCEVFDNEDEDDQSCWVRCTQDGCLATGPTRRTVRGAILAWNELPELMRMAEARTRSVEDLRLRDPEEERAWDQIFSSCWFERKLEVQKAISIADDYIAALRLRKAVVPGPQFAPHGGSGPVPIDPYGAVRKAIDIARELVLCEAGCVSLDDEWEKVEDELVRRGLLR